MRSHSLTDAHGTKPVHPRAAAKFSAEIRACRHKASELELAGHDLSNSFDVFGLGLAEDEFGNVFFANAGNEVGAGGLVVEDVLDDFSGLFVSSRERFGHLLHLFVRRGELFFGDQVVDEETETNLLFSFGLEDVDRQILEASALAPRATNCCT